MKRRAFAPAGLPGIFLLSAVSLVGCPIYDHENEGCFRKEDCAPGYSCDRGTGECIAPGGNTDGCERPSDCGQNETCDMNGECRLGDCSFADIGCVAGYECSRASGAWRCVPEGSSSGGASSSGGSGPISMGGQDNGGGGFPQGGFGGFGGEISVAGQPSGGQGGESSEGGQPNGGQPGLGGNGGGA